jgi:hypothetical protein
MNKFNLIFLFSILGFITLEAIEITDNMKSPQGELEPVASYHKDIYPNISPNIISTNSIQKQQFKDIDSTIIEYWDSQKARTYSICIFNNAKKILIREYLNKKYYLTDSIDIVNLFITNINDFYIDKTKEIVLNKRKTDTIISGDWSSIDVKCFKNGIEISNKFTWITEEEGQYRFVLNPEFLEFYELIKSILRE